MQLDVPVRIDLTPVPGRFVLVGALDGGHHVFEVEGRPSLPSARAWERAVRRIECVRFRRCDGAWQAGVDVVNHRLPARRPISIDTALALALRGHRINVRSDDPVDGRHLEGVGNGRVSL